MKKLIEKERKKPLELNPRSYSRRIFDEKNLVYPVEDDARREKTQDAVEKLWNDRLF